jgi:hypothetical protein
MRDLPLRGYSLGLPVGGTVSVLSVSPVPIHRPGASVTLYPHPSPLSQLIRSETVVSGHRSLYCFHYDGCLDVAVKRDWDSWSCEKCPLFHVEAGPRDHANAFANDRRGA